MDKKESFEEISERVKETAIKDMNQYNMWLIFDGS